MDLKPDVVTVAVSRVDGGLTVMRVIKKAYGVDENDERVVTFEVDVTPAYIDRLISRYVNDGHWPGGLAPVSWRIVPNDFVDETTDRTYRNAWKDAGNGKPDHDIAKAREVQRIYLRKARLAEFCRLDNDYRIADEAGDTAVKNEIGALRQQYRDVTVHPRIEAAQTIEELKLLKLKELCPEAKGVGYTDKFRFNSAAFPPAVETKSKVKTKGKVKHK